jgi:hypothetical protein
MNRFKFPHCDSRVVHSPEDNCKYCNESGLQELRKVWNINFTGHHDPDKTICPAEAKRPLDTINRWGGNVAMTPEVEQERNQYYKQFREKLADMQERKPSLDEMWQEFFKQREKDIEELTEKRRREHWGG